jgi:tetratricopeptide (TPR) repeat protein
VANTPINFERPPTTSPVQADVGPSLATLRARNLEATLHELLTEARQDSFNSQGLADELGDFVGAARHLGAYQEALQAANARIAVLDREPNAPPERQVAALNDLSLILHDLEHFPEAQKAIERAIAIQEKHVDPDNATLATTYSNLATILRNLGNLSSARGWMERAVAIQERHFDRDHPTLGISYSNLATILQDLGDLPAALAKMERAIAIQERQFAPDHPALATSYSNLALIMRDMGDLAGARRQLERALVIQEAHLDPDHPDLAISYSNLALILRDMGDPRAARAAMRRAIVIGEKRSDPNDPARARSYTKLALILGDLGNLPQATASSLTARRILSIIVVAAGIGAAATVVLGLLRSSGVLQKLHESVKAALGLETLAPWVTVAGLTLGFIVIGLIWAVPQWRARRMSYSLRRPIEALKHLLREKEGTRKFRLDPIPPPVDGEQPVTFERTDQRHEEILRWIRSSELPLLYVTGHSGSGKTSLMQAYVVPMLRRPKAGQAGNAQAHAAAVMFRVFGDIDDKIRAALGAPGAVWKNPPNLAKAGARECIEKAAEAARRNDRRLILVFDQFEEAFVGVAKEDRPELPAVQLARSLQNQPVKGVCCILVAREDYASIFREHGLPERAEGVTWQDVPVFSIRDATRFLRSRLWDPQKAPADADNIAAALAREAETLSDLPDLVTPVALNMIGQIYTDNPTLANDLARLGGTAADGVLSAYVRGRVESGELHEAAPAVLQQMITREGRRQTPAPLDMIANGAEMDLGAAETALLTLARDGLVRKVGERWEVAHDFLAPLLRRVLDRISGSLWRRLRHRWKIG